MAFITAGGLAVHYDLSGPAGAPVVMFANSLGTNFHVWDPQAAALATRFRVLRYDKRGHGLTELPAATDAQPAIDRYADDAIALIDALGIAQVNFCGLSIGGMIGQRLAAKAPSRVASLALCDTANRIGPPTLWDDRVAAVRRGGMAAIVDGVLARWFTEPFRERAPATARGFAAMLARTPVEGYAAACLAIRDADLAADGPRIGCPTLVVGGDQDRTTPPEAAAALRDSIAGARLVVIEQAAHIPTVERPEELNRALLSFLGSVAR